MKIRIWGYASNDALQGITLGAKCLGLRILKIESKQKYHAVAGPEPGWEVTLEAERPEDLEVVDDG